MGGLSRKDVDQIARLARLELGEQEAETLRGELSAILEHMTALAALNTDGVEPMTHAVPMSLRLRADEVGDSLEAEVAVGAAADRKDDYFVVPNIIDAGE